MAEKMTALEAYWAGILILPPGYELVNLADVLLLRRDDGSVVAGFGTSRVTPSGVAWAAERARSAVEEARKAHARAASVERNLRLEAQRLERLRAEADPQEEKEITAS
jgi:hypothetical protein